MQKIKSAALALPALLLAGCAAALPAENTATIETAAAAAPQTLKVYTSASLAPAAQAYAEAQGVALTLTDEAASADLLLTDHAPGGSLLDVTSDTLLAAAAARAGITENANALPLGRSLYGYWARADVLNALLGDGESEEGQVWEAAMFAGNQQLDNLCVIVDHNGLQIDGPVEEVNDPMPLADKFRAFKFHVVELADGNDFDQIRAAFAEARATKGQPTAIIAETTKGKGVSFMENQVGWHGKAPNDEQFEQAMAELTAAGEEL